MARLSDQDIDIAILWLDCNEGEGGEREACKRVADYLEAILDRRAAKEAGVSLGYLRRIKAEKSA